MARGAPCIEPSGGVNKTLEIGPVPIVVGTSRQKKKSFSLVGNATKARSPQAAKNEKSHLNHKDFEISMSFEGAQGPEVEQRSQKVPLKNVQSRPK